MIVLLLSYKFLSRCVLVCVVTVVFLLTRLREAAERWEGDKEGVKRVENGDMRRGEGKRSRSRDEPFHCEILLTLLIHTIRYRRMFDVVFDKWSRHRSYTHSTATLTESVHVRLDLTRNKKRYRRRVPTWYTAFYPLAKRLRRWE